MDGGRLSMKFDYKGYGIIASTERFLVTKLAEINGLQRRVIFETFPTIETALIFIEELDKGGKLNGEEIRSILLDAKRIKETLYTYPEVR